MKGTYKKIYFITENVEKTIAQDFTEIWNIFECKNLEELIIDNPDKIINVNFIVGYTPEHLYFFIKTDQKELQNRDRAYQNGDGFNFVLAKPKANGEPSGEFYVIAVSPLNDQSKRSFIWYKNIDFVADRLDKTDTRMISKDEGNYFMIKIPFDEIEPIKPLLVDKYGINIAYVQAVSKGTNVYILEEDMKIQSEQSLRRYQIYNFEKPQSSKEIRWNVYLDKVHCINEEELTLQIGAIGTLRTVHKVVKVEIENEIIFEKNLKIEPGLNRWSFDLDVYGLKPGKYCVKIKEKSFLINETYLTIYDQKLIDELGMKIKDLKEEKRADLRYKSSVNTFEYRYKEFLEKMDLLKPYEPFDHLKKEIEKLNFDINKVKNGNNLFRKGELLRLAYISDFDDSLQPYSLYVPDGDINEYSLMVFLHGSGTDDRSVFKNELIKELAEINNMIILAPYARGTSHAYCPKEALEDVKDITEKIMKLFPIDKDIVILAGFSMGGYGVLRNYDYYKDLYRGLVIISGIYSFNEDYKELSGNIEIPDYSKRVNAFRDIPIIIFHGKEDRNCPFEKMKSFVDKVKIVNDNVEFFTDENRGHSRLTEDWLVKLNNWINNL
ncbi:MAG: prolyl oligopeptidase family serine peptidase [Thermoplasmatota archaeon]